MPEQKDLKIAILIDADNVSYSKIEGILNEVKRYGVPTIKRIYGDWTSPYVSNWKDKLLTHAITPIQQYSYTQGKNSTDSALIIDAMDILHSDRVDGFCIVSSDSDFTRLATRLRESGKLVLGIGERKTPQPFISSCDKFIYVEILNKSVVDEITDSASNAQDLSNQKSTTKNNQPAIDEETLSLLKDTVNDTADESGWAFLGEIGSLIIKRKPDFDARNYGFEKISQLFKALKKDFEIDERMTEKSKIKHIYIKRRNQKTALPPFNTTLSGQRQVTIPSVGNTITADDVKKNQIRITKNFSTFFPNSNSKLKVFIKNEFTCTFTYRRDRSHVLRLGKDAARELGLEEAASFHFTKLDELSYKIEKVKN